MRFCFSFALALAGCFAENPRRAASGDAASADALADTATGTSETDLSSSTLCDGDCARREWTACTCALADPCGWRGDKLCDGYCLEEKIVEEMFDDRGDCPGPCTGLCAAGLYARCTCSVGDPCGWAGDGRCDDLCVRAGFVQAMFDDWRDCADAGPSTDDTTL